MDPAKRHEYLQLQESIGCALFHGIFADHVGSRGVSHVRQFWWAAHSVLQLVHVRALHSFPIETSLLGWAPRSLRRPQTMFAHRPSMPLEITLGMTLFNA